MRLLEKDQDKRAVVEKEPSTLERNEEDESKYYLSYPKPPVLDIKWENRYVNVAEWRNIPKFNDSFQTSRIILLMMY